MVWNVSGALSNALLGFLTLPILVKNLGAEHYGLWSMVSAVSMYLGALEMGLGNALGRYIAGSRVDGDIQRTRNLVWTSSVVLILLALAALATGLIVAGMLPHTLLISAGDAFDMERALRITSVLVAVSIAASAPNALLWGYERFDLINAAENPAIIVRGAAIVALVDQTTTLTDLAWIVSGTGLITVALRLCFAWRISPEVLARPGVFSPSLVGGMFNLGAWYAVLTAGRAVVPQLPVFVIGYLLTPHAVTLYSVARQLIAYSNWLCAAASQVFVPRATRFHMSEQRSSQRDLFRMGSWFSLVMALFFAGGFASLGGAFIHLWQPSLTVSVYYYLMAMLAGETVAMAQWTSSGIILGMGRHRYLAVMNVVEGCASITACSIAAKLGGLGEICATLGVIALVRGLLLLYAGLELVKYTSWEYCRMILLPCVPTLIGIGAAWLLFHYELEPASWGALIGLGTLYAIAFCCTTLAGVVISEGRSGLERLIKAF